MGRTYLSAMLFRLPSHATEQIQCIDVENVCMLSCTPLCFLSSIFENSIVHANARDSFTRRYEPIEIFFIIDTTFESKMFSFLFPLSPLSLLPTNRPFHRRCVTPEIGSRRPDWPSPTARRVARAGPRSPTTSTTHSRAPKTEPAQCSTRTVRSGAQRGAQHR